MAKGQTSNYWIFPLRSPYEANLYLPVSLSQGLHTRLLILFPAIVTLPLNIEYILSELRMPTIEEVARTVAVLDLLAVN